MRNLPVSDLQDSVFKVKAAGYAPSSAPRSLDDSLFSLSRRPFIARGFAPGQVVVPSKLGSSSSSILCPYSIPGRGTAAAAIAAEP